MSGQSSASNPAFSRSAAASGNDPSQPLEETSLVHSPMEAGHGLFDIGTAMSVVGEAKLMCKTLCRESYEHAIKDYRRPSVTVSTYVITRTLLLLG